MSKKQEREIEQKADLIISALQQRGHYYLPDDRSGIASAVVSRVSRLCGGFDLALKAPQFKGDGDYEFTSASHLGTKPAAALE